MSVDPRISLQIVNREIEACTIFAEMYRWKISSINETTQKFNITMKCPIDNSTYIILIQFDDYREIPILYDFINPNTKQIGVSSAYPAPSKGSVGGFFHKQGPCICHPSSRKAYGDLGGPHKNDWNMSKWELIHETGNIKNICSMLRAIWCRISDPEIYGGRMNG